ncbi:MAG: PLP-dependent aminotransferase family protein, partial [Planctomycetota bacterium]
MTAMPRLPINSALPKGSLSTYYNASRLRYDAWNRLDGLARSLDQAGRRGMEQSRLHTAVQDTLALLKPIEGYWAFPGKRLFKELLRLFERREYEALTRHVSRIVRLLVSDTYRRRDLGPTRRHEYHAAEARADLDDVVAGAVQPQAKPYFEVLVVDDLAAREEREVRHRLLEMQRDEDDFVYDLVMVRSFEDALIAILFNYNIQSCLIRYSFPLHSTNSLEILREYLAVVEHEDDIEGMLDNERSILLGRVIKRLRPELDVFLVTDAPVEDVAGTLGREFRRIFYRQEDYRELHLSILKGIQDRFDTPFFDALREYSRKPTGVFHAMPISRGKSIAKSHWIQDMEAFYGSNIFLAETSATTGGLDSLLQPHGALREAQRLAARAFGARRTFFVTGGTSTANKIVLQALARPGEIVLLARDCHKSQHYAVLLSGAYPVYMDAYPLSEYSIYGAVPLREIKRHLLALRRAGKLDRVKVLLLTNCTFDGISYDARRVMMEILAIKPDMVFVWDEAWYAFAYFTPTTRQRTSLDAANRIRALLKSEAYRKQYRQWKADFDRKDPNDERTWLDEPLLPDPDRAMVRVYATQSTHKTLSALRQGSMIHVHDQIFDQEVVEEFNEAYMTHTSTSPNYQILASLDIGRRQVELEGYELVQKAIELAMMLRERIRTHPLLKRYFQVLAPRHLIPDGYRPSNLETYYDTHTGWSPMESAWREDEFVLDPTRVTLEIGRTGMDGNTFKKLLMDRYDIQINKTSRNAVLFLI